MSHEAAWGSRGKMSKCDSFLICVDQSATVKSVTELEHLAHPVDP